jgi:hypothetical protein
MATRYLRARMSEKGVPLDELCELTGWPVTLPRALVGPIHPPGPGLLDPGPQGPEVALSGWRSRPKGRGHDHPDQQRRESRGQRVGEMCVGRLGDRQDDPHVSQHATSPRCVDLHRHLAGACLGCGLPIAAGT